MKKLKLYISHATSFDFREKLYLPLQQSFLSRNHQLILPHAEKNDPNNSKEIISQSDLLLAEVSYASTGQGIELGWANMLGIPIICVFKQGNTYSSSLSLIAAKIVSYVNHLELINTIENCINEFCEH